MPWTINSEIYPLWARSTCFSISTSVNWGANLIISFSFLSLTKSIIGAFYLYAFFASIGWIYFFYYLPETKGKVLEEIETLFETDSTRLTLSRPVVHIDYLQIRGASMRRAPNDTGENED